MLVLANVSFSYQLAGGTGETQEWDVLNVEDCSWKMEMEIEDGRMGGWVVGRLGGGWRGHRKMEIGQLLPPGQTVSQAVLCHIVFLA